MEQANGNAWERARRCWVSSRPPAAGAASTDTGPSASGRALQRRPIARGHGNGCQLRRGAHQLLRRLWRWRHPLRRGPDQPWLRARPLRARRGGGGSRARPRTRPSRRPPITPPPIPTTTPRRTTEQDPMTTRQRPESSPLAGRGRACPFTYSTHRKGYAQSFRYRRPVHDRPGAGSSATGRSPGRLDVRRPQSGTPGPPGPDGGAPGLGVSLGQLLEHGLCPARLRPAGFFSRA